MPHVLVDHPSLGALLASFGPRMRLTIGRAPWCDLVVDWDPAVSRTHAIVEAFGPLLTIEPAGATTNAVLVDGVEVTTRSPLEDRQVVTLGATALLIRLPPAGALSATARVADAISVEPAPLTRAERRLAEALARDPGATNREIAERLGLSHETVRSQVQALLRKARATAPDPHAVDRTTVIQALVASGRLDLDAEPPQAPAR